jgi:hypothetical protein
MRSMCAAPPVLSDLEMSPCIMLEDSFNAGPSNFLPYVRSDRSGILVYIEYRGTRVCPGLSPFGPRGEDKLDCRDGLGGPIDNTPLRVRGPDDWKECLALCTLCGSDAWGIL